MPYINKDRRWDFNSQVFELARKISSCGELNYVLTDIALAYLQMQKGPLSYKKINEVVGVMECAKQEFYRRMAVPYENEKIEENGDVYSSASEK